MRRSLRACICRNAGLRRLNLARNRLGDAGAASLLAPLTAGAGAAAGLEELLLCENDIGEEGGLVKSPRLYTCCLHSFRSCECAPHELDPRA